MSTNPTPNLNSVKKVKFNIQGSKKEINDTKYVSSTKKEAQLLEGISHNLLLAAAERLKINSQNLSEWIELQGCHSVLGRNGFLKCIYEYDLDPFSGEIIFIPSSKPDQSSWPFITIEGWTKLVNQHPEFCGIEFFISHAEDLSSPNWMECSIYRKDRIKPITVREYLKEVCAENRYWQDRPNRMLRHRVLSQCAKLAFGIYLPENSNHPKYESEKFRSPQNTNSQKILREDRLSSLKEILNQ